MSTTIIGGDLISQITGGVFELETSVDLESSDLLPDSPAAILATYIKNQSLLTAPSSGGSWPLFISHFPDGINVEDDAGGIWDSPSIKNGRHMIGSSVFHYGVMLKIRSRDYDDGWDKINAIATEMDTVHNETVTIEGSIYQVQTVNRSGGIGILGKEPGTKRRDVFSVNWLTAIRQIS